MDVQQWVASNPNYVWLACGLIFLALAMTVGEPIVAALGFAALITAVAALSVPSAVNQLLIWSILSLALSVVLRGMVPRRSRELAPDEEATVSETIPKGGIGWVSYEGALWKARSQISDRPISAGETVYVVGRQGLTLLVLPSSFDDEPIDRYRA